MPGTASLVLCDFGQGLDCRGVAGEKLDFVQSSWCCRIPLDFKRHAEWKPDRYRMGKFW